MSSHLMLATCSCCGEPLFRHRRPSGRQISCLELRHIDERFKASSVNRPQPIRAFEVLNGGHDRDRKEGIR